MQVKNKKSKTKKCKKIKKGIAFFAVTQYNTKVLRGVAQLG